MEWFDERFTAAEEKGFKIRGDCQRPTSFYVTISFPTEVYFNLKETEDMNKEQFIRFLRKRIKDGIYEGKITEYIGNLPMLIFMKGD